MSKQSFPHKINNISVLDGKKIIHEEEVTETDNGMIKFKFYHKENDKIYKISGIEKENNTFIIIITDQGKKDTETLSREEVLKKFGKNKDLKFAIDYIKDMKGGRRASRLIHETKRRSRKTSRKVSRRGSRKGSRRVSRKGSRRGSRK
jgi:hypothetical protein